MNEPITDTRLAEIKAGCEGVTSGPWDYDWIKSEEFETFKVINSHGDTIVDALNNDVAEIVEEGHDLDFIRFDNQAHKDILHVARMDPDTVLSMIARIEANADGEVAASWAAWAAGVARVAAYDRIQAAFIEECEGLK